MEMNTFTLLSFNCFGIMNWSTRIRLLALASKLNRMDLDVACIQEVQSHANRRLLLASTDHLSNAAFIPHVHCPKGGLLTLSRCEIEQTNFVRYEHQGHWFRPTVMDRILQKGMLITNLRWQALSIIVINTHLLANYGANWDLNSGAARMQHSQLRQLAAIVQEQPEDALVMVAGDFNLPRGSWLYDEFLTSSRLEDPLTGDERPTYRPLPGIPAYYALPIDFVFVRKPSHPTIQVQSDLYFAEKVSLTNSRTGYLSDHIAIKTCVVLAPEPGDAGEDQSPLEPPQPSLQNGY
jgi:endonuclease/exonuclease/phosphatase family metal-dependent hydrolase